MNSDSFKKLIESARRVSLDGNKKDEIRSRIVSFIEFHPVRDLSAIRLKDTRSRLLKNPLFILARSMSVALIIMLVLGGGVSLASEQALPGDPLYAVKVGVNEEVRGWLSLSEEASAKWETRRIERRLEETEELAAGGNLNAEVRAGIESNFKEHADRVEERIAKFSGKQEAQAALEASSRFEASLQAHDEILNRFAGDDDSVSVHTEAIRVKVKARILSAAKARAEAEESISAHENGGLEEAARGKLKAAENKLAEAKRFVSAMKENVGARVALDAEVKLNASEAAIREGKAYLETKTYGEAFTSFQKAIRLAQEAQILIAAERRIEVRIENDTDVESDRSDEDNDASSSIEVETEAEASDNVKVEGGVRVKVDL